MIYEPRHNKNCLMACANNKGADQPAHPRSLISTFIDRFLDIIIPVVSQVARSNARQPGMRTVAGSILTSAYILSWSLVVKVFLRPFSPCRCFKKGSCQLLAKECALNTDKLPRRLAQEQCGYVN